MFVREVVLLCERVALGEPVCVWVAEPVDDLVLVWLSERVRVIVGERVAERVWVAAIARE